MRLQSIRCDPFLRVPNRIFWHRGIAPYFGILLDRIRMARLQCLREDGRDSGLNRLGPRSMVVTNSVAGS